MNDRYDDPAHEALRTSLGAYALGALPADEAAGVELHLRDCAHCRGELDEIRPAAEALADLRGTTPVLEQAPDELGPRVLASVGAERRTTDRSRWARSLTGGVVAAAVLGVVVVGGVRLTAPDPAKPVPLEAVPVTSQEAGIKATADLVPHTWGIEVKLQATGFEAGQRYLVTVQGKDGEDHEAGEFVGVGAKEMDCNLSSSVLRDAAVGFQVRDAAGDVLVTSTF